METITIVEDDLPKQDNDQLTVLTDNPDLSLENRIKAFKKLIYGNYKSGNISADSAIKYLEAIVNFDYAAADSFYAFVYVDTARFYLDLDQEKQVAVEDLADVYEDMIDSLEAIYDDIRDSYKHLVMADLIKVSDESSSLIMDLIPVFGYDDQTYPYGSFGPTDYWYWGWELGKCNGYSGSGDAEQQLEYRINHPLVQPTQYGYRVYYTDIQQTGYIYFWEYEDENYPGEWEPYRLFYATGNGPNPPEEPCICPDDLNYYLYDGLDYIIDDRLSDFPGLDFAYCEVLEDIVPGNEYWGRLHEIVISYGIKHETIIPPEAF